ARGGMGVVYRARRVEGGFEQRVAIKVLKRGYDTGDFVRRFRTEQQILADLDHPHIARLLDGGATDDGLPYLVMELVDGERLDAFCDTKGPGLGARLELFAKICEAVHTAHQHMVVHCDLKPSNILVTPGGEPKLLDFGIAKVLRQDPDLATRTFSLRLGTPPYASPEQIEGGAVTTASDVYSLGAILFRLLAGRPPMRALPADAPPQLPSRARAHLQGSAPPRDGSPIRASPVDPKDVRGDLDAVVLAAMAREPDERYASAAALGEDLRRHRRQLPVHAKPYTWGYATRLFVRRRRRELAVAALFLSLVGAAGANALRLSVDRQVATARADEMQDAYLEMIEVMDPTAGESPADAARTALEKILASEPFTQQEDQAILYDRVGRFFLRSGFVDEAEGLLDSALELRRELGEPTSEAQAESVNNLGVALGGKGEHESAAAHFRQARAFYEAHPEWDRGSLLDILHNLAGAEEDLGRPEQAEALFRHTLARRRDHFGADSKEVASTAKSLANLFLRQGRYAEAEPLLREALTAQEDHFGRKHSKVATTLLSLGLLNENQGRPAEAVELYRRALWIRLDIFGADSTKTARARSALASSLLRRGLAEDPRAAKSLLVPAVESLRSQEGPTKESTLVAQRNLAAAHLALGELDAAEALLREVDSRAGHWSQRNAWRIADVRSLLGAVLTARGQLDEARGFLEGTWQTLAETQGDGSLYVREAKGRWEEWVEMSREGSQP
ncbi:MAG: serine/threonine-protein kinase, partial [Holophagales bacterium]|nr:serine/threonine-protein kinase [Holophagales bacterium]